MGEIPPGTPRYDPNNLVGNFTAARDPFAVENEPAVEQPAPEGGSSWLIGDGPDSVFPNASGGNQTEAVPTQLPESRQLQSIDGSPPVEVPVQSPPPETPLRDRLRGLAARTTDAIIGNSDENRDYVASRGAEIGDLYNKPLSRPLIFRSAESAENEPVPTPVPQEVRAVPQPTPVQAVEVAPPEPPSWLQQSEGPTRVTPNIRSGEASDDVMVAASARPESSPWADPGDETPGFPYGQMDPAFNQARIDEPAVQQGEVRDEPAVAAQPSALPEGKEVPYVRPARSRTLEERIAKGELYPHEEASLARRQAQGSPPAELVAPEPAVAAQPSAQPEGLEQAGVVVSNDGQPFVNAFAPTEVASGPAQPLDSDPLPWDDLPGESPAGAVAPEPAPDIDAMLASFAADNPRTSDAGGTYQVPETGEGEPGQPHQPTEAEETVRGRGRHERPEGYVSRLREEHGPDSWEVQAALSEVHDEAVERRENEPPEVYLDRVADLYGTDSKEVVAALAATEDLNPADLHNFTNRTEQDRKQLASLQRVSLSELDQLPNAELKALGDRLDVILAENPALASAHPEVANLYHHVNEERALVAEMVAKEREKWMALPPDEFAQQFTNEARDELEDLDHGLAGDLERHRWDTDITGQLTLEEYRNIETRNPQLADELADRFIDELAGLDEAGLTRVAQENSGMLHDVSWMLSSAEARDPGKYAGLQRRVEAAEFAQTPEGRRRGGDGTWQSPAAEPAPTIVEDDTVGPAMPETPSEPEAGGEEWGAKLDAEGWRRYLAAAAAADQRLGPDDLFSAGDEDEEVSPLLQAKFDAMSAILDAEADKRMKEAEAAALVGLPEAEAAAVQAEQRSKAERLKAWGRKSIIALGAAVTLLAAGGSVVVAQAGDANDNAPSKHSVSHSAPASPGLAQVNAQSPPDFEIAQPKQQEQGGGNTSAEQPGASPEAAKSSEAPPDRVVVTVPEGAGFEKVFAEKFDLPPAAAADLYRTAWPELVKMQKNGQGVYRVGSDLRLEEPGDFIFTLPASATINGWVDQYRQQHENDKKEDNQ